ncbi:MAG: hypothetical protein ACI81P_003030 [Neolewinella sp.]|jgi:hypothetical protein
MAITRFSILVSLLLTSFLNAQPEKYQRFSAFGYVGINLGQIDAPLVVEFINIHPFNLPSRRCTSQLKTSRSYGYVRLSVSRPAPRCLR